MPEGDSSGPTSEASYFLPTSINQQSIDLLVDTGSSFSILRKDTWDRLFPQGEPLTPSKRAFVGVDGNHLNVQGSCQIQIVICGKTFTLEVLLMQSLQKP